MDKWDKGQLLTFERVTHLIVDTQLGKKSTVFTQVGSAAETFLWQMQNWDKGHQLLVVWVSSSGAGVIMHYQPWLQGYYHVAQ